ncbi:MAG: phospholipase C [Flavobacteriales bacterium]
MSDTKAHTLLSFLHHASKDPGTPELDMPFLVNVAGKLSVDVQSYWQVNIRMAPRSPFTYTLLDPTGFKFDGNEVTMAVLDKFRDNRGSLDKPWILRIHPLTKAQTTAAGIIRVGDGQITVTVTEEIQNISAPPVIPEQQILNNVDTQKIEFDLYRLGQLRVRSKFKVFNASITAKEVWLTLLDPNGVLKASGRSGDLDYDITDSDLGLSRDEHGRPRKWAITVMTGAGYAKPPGSGLFLSAQVYGKTHIPASVLQTRLETLLGTTTSPTMVISAQWDKEEKTNLLSLRINDQLTAETISMHDLLDNIPKDYNQGKDGNHPVTGVDYVLRIFNNGEGGTFDYHLEANKLRTKFISIGLKESVERKDSRRVPAGTHTGPSATPTGFGAGTGKLTVIGTTGYALENYIAIPAGLPMLAIAIDTTGTVKIPVNNWDDAEVVLSKLRVEVALTPGTDGKLHAAVWVDPSSVKYGGSEGESHGSGLFKDILATFRSEIFQAVQSGMEGILPSLFDIYLGGRFTFTGARWKNNAMEFDYIAGEEIEPKPFAGYNAHGTARDIGPRVHADRTDAENLKKVDHIVVLMMENRSFDHVLGYRSLQGVSTDTDGLTAEIIAKFRKPSTNTLRSEAIEPLANAGFSPKTQIPISVGHEYSDVAEQINNGAMDGFVKNVFTNRPSAAQLAEMASMKCVPKDVMGYYTNAELPMYGYLADEYGIGDRFFSSHPGPTMPNRMYSLTGDLMIDRFGERLMNNGGGGGVQLSRIPTVFDLLSRQGVSWRVYESPPSVSMLRFFSRYAGADDSVIRDIEKLEADVLKGDLPAVTFIDPAYHYARPNDDHPPADMANGQILVQRVYQALKANKALWGKTLLVLTYDEHGGLFDHVPPPIAEIWEDPKKSAVHGSMAPVGSAAAPHGTRGTSAAAPTSVAGTATTHEGPHRLSVVDMSSILSGLHATTVAPDTGAGSKYKADVPVTYGIRVPLFLISPWVEKGSVHHETWDFGSILKTIVERFCPTAKPFLSDRVSAAGHFGKALTRPAPRDTGLIEPVLQRPPTVKSGLRMRTKFFSKADLTKPGADFHEFMTVLGRMTRGS